MKKALFLAAAALCLATAAPFAAFPQEAPATAAVGQLAPEIQIGDWINGDGRTQLADFRGEVIFLEFWATT